MKLKTLICIVAWSMCIFCQAQNKYALLVGISNYHVLDKNSEWNDIHGVNDVNLIQGALKKQGFAITTLTEAKATHQNIVSNLKALERKIQVGSIVYIHFSMHGQPFDDTLSPTKGDELWDESLVPIDAKIEYDSNDKYVGQNHLVDDELNILINKIRKKIGVKGILYVAIDACHAGRSSKGISEITRGTKRAFKKAGKKYVPEKERPSYFTISSVKGYSPVIYLEACKGREVNTEMKFGQNYYGPMSYFIWKVLTKNNLTKDVKWVGNVKTMMDKEGPAGQHMVIERSK